MYVFRQYGTKQYLTLSHNVVS